MPFFFLKDLVSSTRRLIREAPMRVEVNSRVDDYYLILFNDLLLFTKKRTGFLKKDGFEFKGKVDLDGPETKITNLADSNGRIKKKQKKIFFFFLTNYFQRSTKCN